MATIDIAAINIPAGADSTDTQAALSAYFAGEVPANPTLAQLTEALRQKNIKWIKETVRDYRRAQAAAGEPGLT